jgi:hypothetical protein
LKQLDISTGSYTTIFTIERSFTTPPHSGINACGINPIDSIIYCSVQAGAGNYYLCRIDNSSISFVARLPGSEFYASGAFGADGTFFIAYNNATSKQANIYTLEGLDEMPGYGSLSDAIPNFDYLKPYTDPAMPTFADFAFLHADLEGTGSQDYLVAMNPKLVIVRVSSTPYQTWSFFVGASGQHNGFGAAWGFDGEVYFASNAGLGVYHLDVASVDLVAQTAKVEVVGASAETQSNDGLNCLPYRSPW